MAQSKQALAEVRGDTLYDRLRLLNSETQQILQEAKQSKNPDLALRAINRIERQLELEAKLLGQLDESAKIAIGINNAPPQTYLFPRTKEGWRAVLIALPALVGKRISRLHPKYSGRLAATLLMGSEEC